MKHLLFAFLCCILSISGFAREGYKIQIKFNGEHDTMVYLAHYFAKPLPTIYKMDSTKIDKKGNAIFDNKNKITGGIYIILPAARNNYFELLLNNGDELNISADMSKLPESISFKNSKENDDFLTYQQFLKQFGKKQEVYKRELETAVTKQDTSNIQDKSMADFKLVEKWRNDYMAQHPNNLLTHIFQAAEKPKIPEGTHYLPNGKVDSSFAWHYYRNHYWDGFAFKDDRLIHTPLLEGKMDEYFNKVVPQNSDTVINEADSFLAKVRGSENLFKYSLNWLSTNAQTTNIMGMDKVFVHLVENYYQKGDADWLNSEELEKYFDRSAKIAPNIIGNDAPQLKLTDLDNKEKTLLDINAKYTLLIFYSPTCGHCMHKIPLIDSAWRASLKDKGVKIFAVLSDASEEAQWKEFIKKNHLQDWINVWDPKRNSRFHAFYDVETTPSIYLIDEKKKIIGKKLDENSIGKVIEMVERREAANKM